MEKKTSITYHQKNKFLKALATCGNIKKSAEMAKIPYHIIFKYKKNDELFRNAMEEAISQSINLLEDEAKRRALEGVEEPIFYKGEYAGSKTKYSDSLLVTLLKAHYPEKYGDKPAVINIDMGVMLDEAMKKIKN